MGENAKLEHDYIEIDTAAWIAGRTGGPLEELTEIFGEFEASLSEASSLAVEAAPLFATARAGSDWEAAEFAIIATAGGGSTASLSENVKIHRYTDPQYGDVALITVDTRYGRDETTAYAENPHQDPAAWFDFDAVDIFCPAGHGWMLRGSELVDQGGNCHKPADIFGPEGIVTRDQDDESGESDEYRILCPTCGALCDVELTDAS